MAEQQQQQPPGSASFALSSHAALASPFETAASPHLPSALRESRQHRQQQHHHHAATASTPGAEGAEGGAAQAEQQQQVRALQWKVDWLGKKLENTQFEADARMRLLQVC